MERGQFARSQESSIAAHLAAAFGGAFAYDRHGGAPISGRFAVSILPNSAASSEDEDVIALIILAHVSACSRMLPSWVKMLTANDPISRATRADP